MADKFPANRTWQDVEKAERQRNDAVSLLKSLSVQEPLLNQLVQESMTGFIFISDKEGRVERDRRGRGFQQLQTNYDALQCQENVVHGKKIYQSSS